MVFLCRRAVIERFSRCIHRGWTPRMFEEEWPARSEATDRDGRRCYRSPAHRCWRKREALCITVVS